MRKVRGRGGSKDSHWVSTTVVGVRRTWTKGQILSAQQNRSEVWYYCCHCFCCRWSSIAQIPVLTTPVSLLKKNKSKRRNKGAERSREKRKGITFEGSSAFQSADCDEWTSWAAFFPLSFFYPVSSFFLFVRCISLSFSALFHFVISIYGIELVPYWKGKIGDGEQYLRQNSSFRTTRGTQKRPEAMRSDYHPSQMLKLLLLCALIRFVSK